MSTRPTILELDGWARSSVLCHFSWASHRDRGLFHVEPEGFLSRKHNDWQRERWEYLIDVFFSDQDW